ncbi:hypothetical protein [Butyrivibrio fibrisolvens]|uniref:hypothetical protein n=1 Tax=Butyrivibrio fibrisolvens TaxID=831 RepID=UPI0003B499D7|nr:hypothetical protein [Butyrivibrio fibrisolvens]
MELIKVEIKDADGLAPLVAAFRTQLRSCDKGKVFERTDTFLSIKFKNAAIEPIEFDFVEGSIANRFIELRNSL